MTKRNCRSSINLFLNWFIVGRLKISNCFSFKPFTLAYIEVHMQVKSVFAYFCNTVVPQQITYLICCPYHGAIACFTCCAFYIIAYTLNFFNRKHNIPLPQQNSINIHTKWYIQTQAIGEYLVRELAISILYIHTNAIDDFSRFLLLLTYSNACVCERACVYYVYTLFTCNHKVQNGRNFILGWTLHLYGNMYMQGIMDLRAGLK